MAWTVKSGKRLGDNRGFLIEASEEADNSSDKSFVVEDELGNNVELEIHHIRLEFDATAGAGTRKFTIEIKDEDADVIFSLQLNANSDVIADGSEVTELIPGSDVVAAIGAGPHRDFLPKPFFIRSGQTLRIYDSEAVAASADDMQIHISGEQF